MKQSFVSERQLLLLAGTYQGVPVAVKAQRQESGETRERLREEASVLIHLRHCNIVRLVGVVQFCHRPNFFA